MEKCLHDFAIHINVTQRCIFLELLLLLVVLFSLPLLLAIAVVCVASILGVPVMCVGYFCCDVCCWFCPVRSNTFEVQGFFKMHAKRRERMA